MKLIVVFPLIAAACAALALIAPQRAVDLAGVVSCIALSLVAIAMWVRDIHSDADLWRNQRRRRR